MDIRGDFNTKTRLTIYDRAKREEKDI